MPRAWDESCPWEERRLLSGPAGTCASTALGRGFLQPQSAVCIWVWEAAGLLSLSSGRQPWTALVCGFRTALVGLRPHVPREQPSACYLHGSGQSPAAGTEASEVSSAPPCSSLPCAGGDLLPSSGIEGNSPGAAEILEPAWSQFSSELRVVQVASAPCYSGLVVLGGSASPARECLGRGWQCATWCA